MHIKTLSFTERDFERQMTDLKNLVIDFLYKKGIIDDKTTIDLRDNYAVLLRKPSFFWRLIGLRKKVEELIMIIVKQETLEEPKEEEPPVKLVDNEKEKA